MINFFKKYKNHPVLVPFVNLKRFFEEYVLGNSMIRGLSYFHIT